MRGCSRHEHPAQRTHQSARCPAQIIVAWREHRYALVTSTEQLLELDEVGRGRSVRRPSPTDNFLPAMAQAGEAAYEVTQDRDRSIFWFRNTPIPEFGHRTAERLVAEVIRARR